MTNVKVSAVFKGRHYIFCVGLITIGVSIPLYLGKIKMNYLYGFRIRKGFESEENWYLINRY